LHPMPAASTVVVYGWRRAHRHTQHGIAAAEVQSPSERE
jgi:hypothetical protein